MEEWVKQILKDERQKRGEPLEVKKIGQNYYLYQSTLYGLGNRTRGRRFLNILESLLKEV